MIGIYAGNPSGTQRERKRKQYAKSRDRAVGRDKERADVNENGVHLNKNIVSGQ